MKSVKRFFKNKQILGGIIVIAAVIVLNVLAGYATDIYAAPPTLVHSASVQNYASNVTTQSVNVASGNVVAFWVAWQSSSVTLSNITATGGTIGPVTLVDNPTGISGISGRAAMGYAVVTGSGLTTFKATLSGGSQMVFIVHEISGIDTAAPLDGHKINGQNTAGTGANAVSTGAITTTSNGDYIFAAMWQVDSATGITKDTGSWTQREYLHSNGNRYTMSEDEVQSAAGSVTGHFTITRNAPTLAGIMAFRTGAPSPDFSLSISPGSQTVTQGNGAAYTATVNPSNGFSGDVNLSVSGLPSGATGTFTPNPATGSSDLSVTTSVGTPAGSYPLVVTGTSGSLTHNASATLVVTAIPVPDFSISVTPSSQSVLQGNGTTYTATITPTGGFADLIDLSVAGLPSGAVGAFSPNPTTNSSTLSVTTSLSTPVGSYPLTITGTSGSLTHNASATLVVTAPGGSTYSANILNDAEMGNIGDLLSVSVLNASTHGSGGSWSSSASSKFKIGNGSLGSFAVPVTVAGVAYTGSGSRIWDYDHTGDGEFVTYNFPTGNKKVSTGMFIKPGPNITWGDYDFVHFQGVSGQDCVIQYHDFSSPNHYIWSHSWTPVTGTQYGVTINVTAGATYWMTLQYDSMAGTCSVALFNPTTFAQVGATSIAPLDTNVNLSKLTLGAGGHGVTSNTHTYFDDLLIDWTEGKFPLLPQ